jgi:2-polyprenyl-3-methyl-5-hydroxy-6-metoxy-1,4-benzoquinol methylase
MDAGPLPHHAYVFGRHVDDRERLQYQFDLLREDFNLWFDEALRLGGLPTDPDRASWSVLDLGCGEGQFTREIARRYPGADVVGMDVNPAAVEAASAAAAPLTNVRFLVHDAREPIAGTAAGFDVAVLWMVLFYLPDKAAALAHVAAALRPGGVLLLGTVPDDAVRLDHPAAMEIHAHGTEMMRRFGFFGLEPQLEPLLREAGFDDVTTVLLRYLVGGATSHGRRWLAHAMMTFDVGREAVVDICKLMTAADYDRNLERLVAESALDLSGEARFLVTLARLAEVAGEDVAGGPSPPRLDGLSAPATPPV